MVGFGVQLVAPKGFDAFRQGVHYYFIGETKDGFVHLAWFGEEKHGWRVRLITIARTNLEKALADRLLVAADPQLQMPPWLEGHDNTNFEALEDLRPRTRKKKPKRTYKAQAEDRLHSISAALEAKAEILSSNDPLKELNQYVPKGKHPHRVQLFFFAYVLHGSGQDLWTLKKPSENTGRWNRTSEAHKHKKFGLESSDKGTCFNSPSTLAADQICKAYLKRCGPGVTMAFIYREAMVDEFECVAIEVQPGVFTYTHPRGGPIYSYGQFRGRVVRRFGLDQVHKTVYGARRCRRKRGYNEGNFTAQYARLMEAIEVDAYYAHQRPKPFFSEGPGVRLAVARGICCRSSAVAGIGFAIGAENEEAYRAMLFCCAVPKTYIARIYGIPPKDFEDWITLGCPPYPRSDRGPAGVRELVDEVMVKFPMKSVAPSYDPQAKAIVEGTNPKEVAVEGEPTYVQSPLNIVEMMKQELYRGRLENFTRNIASRLTDPEIEEFNKTGRSATPHCLCEYLLEKLCNAGQIWQIERAVRAFWTPTEFTVDKDGVKYRHRHYSSDALKATGFLGSTGSGAVPVKGFSLSAVFLFVWVEIRGRLIEVKALPRARADDEDFATPRAEVDDAAEGKKELESRTRRSAAAADGDTRKKFRGAVGKPFDAGTRKKGTPKVSATATHEAAVAKGKTRAKAAR
ncbi:hypothetical protein GCM10027034_37370 [Ramlibacter solisilvae]|uniref:hypothetical protein n=1 Tax=Ramlibacter tataouinensis TaxID=94132 RepID=UPI0011AEBAC1|nr:hypothetical protein [Ramlibacter tataouinensis]